MLRGAAFGYLHLFPFSPRPGREDGHCMQRTRWPLCREERMAALRALAAEKSEAHRRRLWGGTGCDHNAHAGPAPQARTNDCTDRKIFCRWKIVGEIEANQLIRLRVTRLNGEKVLEALPR